MEYTILLWLKKKELTWTEIGLTIVAGLAVAGGVYGEYFFGSRASDAALQLQNISDQQVADANKRAAEANARAAEAQRALERERIERLKIEAALKPRALTLEQQKIMLPCLKTSPKGTVFVVPKVFDEEAGHFAAQIFVLLSEAGFDVRHEPAGKPRPFSFGVQGVFLFLADISKPPSHAEPMQRCFRSANIALPSFGGIPDWAGPTDVMLAVGSKP